MIRPPQEQIYARLRIARDYARVNQELHDDKVMLSLSDDLAEARALLEKHEAGDLCSCSHADTYPRGTDCVWGNATEDLCWEHARRDFLARTK